MQQIYLADKIYTNSKGIIEKGVIITENGIIKDVFSSKDKKIPKYKDAPTHDFGKHSIYPGFIDAHSHITVCGEGVGQNGDDSNDHFDPITPQLTIGDAINPDTPEMKTARAEGIVAAAIFPGSANLICGLGVAISTTTDSLIKSDFIINSTVGMKMALGENPKMVHADTKKFYTRMAQIAFLRDFFIQVQTYKEKKKKERNLKFEIIIDMLDKKFPARVHAHQANDIQNAVLLAEEFGYDIVIEHGTESDLILDFLKQRNVPIVVGPMLYPGVKYECRHRNMETPGKLAKAGIMTAITGDAPVYNIGTLRYYTGMAIKGGMPYEDALKAITSNAARICNIDDKYGDIKPGLEAHFVVWDSDPLKDMQAAVIKIVDKDKVLDTPEW